MQRKHPVVLAAAMIAVATTSASTAHGYLESAEGILAAVAARRAQLSFTTLVAEGYAPGHESASDPVEVWTALVANRALRTERRGAEQTEVLLIRGPQRFTFTQGASAASAERVRADPVFELLGTTQPDPGGQRGRSLLERMGIDVQVVSLNRFEGRPAYVVGARPGQMDRAQLWIDKELEVPVRWLMDEGGQLVEVRLTGYHLPTTGPWFPERIEIRSGREIRDVVVYQRVRLNPPVDKRLFGPPGGR